MIAASCCHHLVCLLNALHDVSAHLARFIQQLQISPRFWQTVWFMALKMVKIKNIANNSHIGLRA